MKEESSDRPEHSSSSMHHLRVPTHSTSILTYFHGTRVRNVGLELLHGIAEGASRCHEPWFADDGRPSTQGCVLLQRIGMRAVLEDHPIGAAIATEAFTHGAEQYLAQCSPASTHEDVRTLRQMIRSLHALRDRFQQNLGAIRSAALPFLIEGAPLETLDAPATIVASGIVLNIGRTITSSSGNFFVTGTTVRNALAQLVCQVLSRPHATATAECHQILLLAHNVLVDFGPLIPARLQYEALLLKEYLVKTDQAIEVFTQRCPLPPATYRAVCDLHAGTPLDTIPSNQLPSLAVGIALQLLATEGDSLNVFTGFMAALHTLIRARTKAQQPHSDLVHAFAEGVLQFELLSPLLPAAYQQKISLIRNEFRYELATLENSGAPPTQIQLQPENAL